MAREKSFEQPDEVRTFDKGQILIADVDGHMVGKAVFEPGWRWSECVKPIVGGDRCQMDHLQYTLKGRMRVEHADGTTQDIEPGQIAHIPPGHDAWVVGDDMFEAIDVRGMANYALPDA